MLSPTRLYVGARVRHVINPTVPYFGTIVGVEERRFAPGHFGWFVQWDGDEDPRTGHEWPVPSYDTDRLELVE